MPRSGRLLRAFRHELSRGMAQLAMLAAALIKTPHMLIADELLNGLDPSVAAEIMDVRTNGTWQWRSSLTTSPRSLVSRTASQSCTAVRSSSMHRSRIYAASRTTHTRLGWSARFPGVTRGRLHHIEGEAPLLVDIDRVSCSFAPRCEYATDICRSESPGPSVVGTSEVRCHHAVRLDLPGIRT